MKQRSNDSTNRLDSGKMAYIDLIEKICAAKNVVFHPARVAEDVMSRDVKIVSLDYTVKDCIDFMKLHGIRHRHG